MEAAATVDGVRDAMDVGAAELIHGLSRLGRALDALRLPPPPTPTDCGGPDDESPPLELVLRGVCVQRDPSDFDDVDLGGAHWWYSSACPSREAAATLECPIVKRADPRVVDELLARERESVDDEEVHIDTGTDCHNSTEPILDVVGDRVPKAAAKLRRNGRLQLRFDRTADETTEPRITLVHLALNVVEEERQAWVYVTVVSPRPEELNAAEQTLLDDASAFQVIGAGRRSPHDACPASRMLTQSRNGLAGLAALGRAIEEGRREGGGEERSPSHLSPDAYRERVEALERRHAQMEKFFAAMLQSLVHAERT